MAYICRKLLRKDNGHHIPDYDVHDDEEKRSQNEKKLETYRIGGIIKMLENSGQKMKRS